jgi:hypothetical protein
VITVLCVLRSGGVYDASWVEKLQRGVDKHLTVPHKFVCMSDKLITIPISGKIACFIVPLVCDFPGWWSKIEIFRPGVIDGPTLYLDLDTIITGPMDKFIERCRDYYFGMLENFNDPSMVGSGVMWFMSKAPEGVYERFVQDPQRIMDYYQNVKVGAYRGDQAFIFDALDRHVDKISSPALRSYKRHCRNGLPEGTSIVAFHGRPRPSEVNAAWVKEHWR